MLISFANSLDPDQDRQNDSVPEEYFEKVDFENKIMKNYQTCVWCVINSEIISNCRLLHNT